MVYVVRTSGNSNIPDYKQGERDYRGPISKDHPILSIKPLARTKQWEDNAGIAQPKNPLGPVEDLRRAFSPGQVAKLKRCGGKETGSTAACTNLGV